MTEGWRRRLLGSLLLLAATAVTTPCRAGATDAEVQSRVLYGKGEKLADSGSWNEACPLFQAAHDLHATGGTALRTADCYEKVGKYERALALYQWMVDHRDIDRNAERVALAEGRAAALRKQLGLDQPATLPTTGPIQGPVHVTPPPAPPNRVPAYVSWGIGGAGLVVGAVFGGLALAQASDVKSHCMGTSCPGQGPAASAATTKAWVANAGFGVAIAGAVVGTVLFLIAPSRAAQSTVRSAVGPSGLTLRF